MKARFLKIALCAVMVLGVAGLAGCASSSNSAGSSANNGKSGASGSISVYSREDGSGTRGAFVELMGIEQDKVDNTTPSAVITNSTSVMTTSVSGDVNGIGYISLGSLNDSVTAVKVDGVEATAAHVKDGSYTVSRPFNIATKADLSAAAKDFMSFIASDDGQKIVEDNGYISEGSTGAYAKDSSASGKAVVAGSSSVTPVMEKLAEAYKAANSAVTIEVQQSDSTTGMNMAAQGTCDIGMASRALKDSETAKGLSAKVIALDGIAIIVNNNSGIDSLSTEQIKSIYTGDVTEWSDVQASA